MKRTTVSHAIAATDEELLPAQISYSVKSAAIATGISESRLRHLIRTGKIVARYDGATVLIDAESLHLYYRSLPSERVVDRECAAQRGAA